MSSDEELDLQPKPKRQKRFKFKTFEERVADVEVDVYRSLGAKRAEPLPGCSSFFQEGLAKWRELNSAEHWLAAAAALNPLTSSLPQLVHHRDEIAAILLGCLRMEALLSLEPVLELTGTLARDLQGDYLPLLPRVLSALADLVDEGLDREPEQLQHLFACLSLICKHLCKLLASEAQLLALLKASQRLRHHRAEHVRALSAESLGFLFRQASGPAIRVGVKAALAEAVTRPTDERVHAAGALLAEAVTGVSHGLHSRAAAVLGPVLREGVLRPDDFKSAKSQAGGKLGQEAIQARVAAALSVCIEQLAQHLRRGKCGELWQLLLAEVDSRLEDLVAAQQRQQQLTAGAGADQPGEAAAPATGGKRGKKGSKGASKAAAAEAAVGAEAGPAAEAAAEEVAAAAASAARGLALLAQLVEHGRGCRVEAYEPLFKLAARLVKPEFLGGSSVGSGQQAVAAADDEQPGVAPLPYGASAVPADFQRPSLSAQVLRLLLALALSHAKVAGASEGPAALAKAAPAWAPAFVRAPAAELLPFMRRLISFPGGADVARPFSQQMLGALGRCLLAGELGEVCWPLLTDVCATLRPGATAGAAGVPILLTASGVGAQLAALVRGKLQSFDRQAAGGAAAAAEAWAALACLPHAAESAAQAAACCAALAAATEPSDEQAAEPGSDSSALLMLHCGALGAQAALLASAGEDSGKQVQSQLLPQALALVVRHPGNYHAVAAAAEVLQAASGSGAELSQQQLQELVPLLAPNLSAASQPLRRETLRVLCCFSQPAMRPPAGAEEPPKDAPPQPCDALQQLLVLESRQQGVDGGRPSVVALGRMRNYLEYRRLPDWLVPAVVHELLGVLHIRFAALWNPAHDALGMALDQYPAVAWPLMHRQLSAAQEAFLGGDCFARPAEASAAAAAAATGQQAAAPPLLGARFVAAAASGEEAAAGGSTDAAVRLNHILKAMAAANNSVVESKAREWVPLFLGFTAANPTAAATEDGGSNGAAGADGQPPAAAEDSEDEEDEEPAAGGNGPRQQQRHSGSGPLTGRAWRSGLREWLALLAGLKGARGMFQWEAVQRAVAVQLMDVDPAIQTGALKCLKVFKLKFLLPYLDRLLRLADNKTLRGELTAFPLAVSVTSLREDEGGSALLAEHRAGLVPLLVRLLFPKMRKRSGRLGGKGAPGSARAAILNFLASAEPHELRPLLELFLAPLSAAFVRPAGEAGQRELEALVGQDDPDAYRLIEGPWWGRCLGRQPGAWWLEHIDAAALNAEPLRKRIGYLNTLEDLLKHLGHRMQIFLPELLALAVCLLEGGVQPLIAEGAAAEAAAGTDAAAAAAAAAGDPVEGAKEVRGRSLRLAAAVLERFPTSCDYGFMWPRLLAATQPLLPRLAAESAADKAPPVIELAAALAASQHLVPVLADGASAAIPAAAARQLAAEPPLPPVEVQPCGEAWAAGGLRLGSALLAHCIAALSASRCSEPSRIAMLGALESIFDLPDPLPQQVLGPHMPALLQGLQSIVVAVWQQGPGGGRSATAGRKGGRGRGGSGSGQPAGPRTGTASRALAILELVGSRVASWEAAQQLTGALLPLLQPREGAGGRRKQRRGDELLVSRTLAVLAALWSRLPGAELEQRPQAGEQLLTVAAVLAPLAGSLEGRDSRQALCAAYSSVAGLLTELAEPAALLSELNALSTTEIDELDYERRMAAYSRLIPAAWQPLTLRQAAPLLHTCLHDLRNADDLALRHAASQALSRFIEGAAAATEAAEAAGASEAAAAQEGGSLLSAAQRVLFPQLKRGLPAPNLAVRQEHLSLLRQLVLAFPDHYAELTILTDTDAEVDFLLNVAHIQLHRRARALVRLTKLLKRASEDAATPSPLGVGTLVGVVQPLLLQMVVEGKGGEEGSGGHELKQADKDRGANVTDAAVVALGAVAGALPWVQYQQLLGQHLRLMKRHADDTASKAVIRSVCVILDAFHFPLPAELDEEQLAAEAAEAAALAAQEAAAERLAAAEAAAAEAAEGAEGRAGKRKDAEADEGEEAAEDEDMPDAAVADAPVLDADVAAVPAQQVVPAGEVYRMLAKRVVPELQRIMVNKETVRAPVALAVVKVLQLLPAAAMRFQLPRTLQKVANLLRVRMQSTRDAARAVLVSMVKQLGPDYLPFVCEVLQSSCPPKGFTAHVLGYTVHAVIEAVAQVGQPGCLDDSLLMILPLMEADLFGEVAEAKEAVEFAGAYKEAKKCRAYETYQLLAGLITFGERAAELLTTVQSRLGEASQPKTRTKLGQLLQHAARGVLGNPTATAEDICMFFFATADSGLAAEEAARDKAKAASGAAVPTGRGGDDGGERAAALHQHLLVEFALSLLQGALRKGIINPRGPGADELLDPLLPLLVRALRSRHAPSVTTSLQALTLLMQSQLPGLQKTAADAGKAVTELLKRCPKTSHPIAQDCFKLLGGMLRQCERWAPSQGQLRFLVTWAFADLEETAGRQNAFHLLKAILARKLVLPEVYDLMNRVQELMVQSQAAPVRSACSSALLQFLLDYPLGEKRLQEHLQFLLTNLSYEHESGREAALDMLGVVLQKFPEPLVALWAEMVFLPLVARLVNDPSSKCRQMVGACLSTLLRRAPPARRDRLAQFCSQWLGGADARLTRAAAQALGILAEVEGSSFGRRVPALLPQLADVLASRAEQDAAAAEAAAVADPGEAEDLLAAAPGWQEAYYSLLLLQRVLEATAAQLAWAAGPAAQRCWGGAQRLLLHRHQWVRKASGRLVGAGLAAPAVGPPWLEAGGAGAAGALALSFFRQLDSEAADDALSGQAVKCLVFLCTTMHDDDAAAGRLPPPLKLSGAAAAAADEDGTNGHAAAEAEDVEQEEGSEDEEERAAGDEQQPGDEAAAAAGGGGSDSEGEEEAEEEAAEAGAADEVAAGSLTLHGLVRRMVRLADDKTYARQQQRGIALRFIAAVASRLGSQRVLPYLPLLMRPLYRITEPGAAGNPEEVTSLADEIVAHLRTLVGADAMLAAYNQAREAVRRQRGERKRKAALQTLVDPEAAAKRKMRKQQRKASGKRKQMEHVKRLRAAGVAVKNKRARMEGQRGGGGRRGRD